MRTIPGQHRGNPVFFAWSDDHQYLGLVRQRKDGTWSANSSCRPTTITTGFTDRLSAALSLDPDGPVSYPPTTAPMKAVPHLADTPSCTVQSRFDHLLERIPNT